jgi:hypothetical protein
VVNEHPSGCLAVLLDQRPVALDDEVVHNDSAAAGHDAKRVNEDAVGARHLPDAVEEEDAHSNMRGTKVRFV